MTIAGANLSRILTEDVQEIEIIKAVKQFLNAVLQTNI